MLAAKDPRAAIKKSWELLAKDILWAGNIGMGRWDPDSPAISRSLQRLESSTTYPFELIVELRDLQMTARKVFNQSQWASSTINFQRALVKAAPRYSPYAKSDSNTLIRVLEKLVDAGENRSAQKK